MKTSQSTARILVVEDEAAIRLLLRHTLTTAGYEMVETHSAEMAIASINGQLPDLILLDWMLPGMSGDQLAKKLRGEERTCELPIILLTAKGEESDRVAGLTLGADDYVTKPFSTKELLARIKALLRRRAPHRTQSEIKVGELYVNPEKHLVYYQDKELKLGRNEYQLLMYMLHHRDKVLSREQLLSALRGDHRFFDDRTIDVYIRRLRSALGEAKEMIKTLRGVGYKFTLPE